MWLDHCGTPWCSCQPYTTIRHFADFVLWVFSSLEISSLEVYEGLSDKIFGHKRVVEKRVDVSALRMGHLIPCVNAHEINIASSPKHGLAVGQIHQLCDGVMNASFASAFDLCFRSLP
jgi:hypothetical protein